jgi:eukaryotic-like serine/threonine-protein kinase
MTCELLNIDSIFLAALELPATDRDAYLDQACGDNQALRARLERLLAAHVQAGSFLESPAPELDATVDQPATEALGTHIGPYQLVKLLGEGGMGVVYLAEQHEPVERRVALKIIKPGLDTHHVIARFEAERHALAMMDHPHVAKVLDAGSTGEKIEGERLRDENQETRDSDSSFIPHPSSFSDPGRPYFVMELVHGPAITAYCDQHDLSIRERLELFIPVCQAVQHAHQKGVIHRETQPLTRQVLATFAFHN